MNKILINLYVPNLNQHYDLFIPVNEFIWKINKLVVKSISDLSDGKLLMNQNYVIANIETGKIYDNNDIVINTDIRNTSKLALIKI
ncbi:MAG: hypothetical protein ACLUGB_05810 [Bacilli bacterium]|jgi:hypothetical protein